MMMTNLILVDNLITNNKMKMMSNVNKNQNNKINYVNKHITFLNNNHFNQLKI